MLLKITNESSSFHDNVDAVVSDNQMEKIIIMLQNWGVVITNPFVFDKADTDSGK